MRLRHWPIIGMAALVAGCSSGNTDYDFTTRPLDSSGALGTAPTVSVDLAATDRYATGELISDDDTVAFLRLPEITASVSDVDHISEAGISGSTSSATVDSFYLMNRELTQAQWESLVAGAGSSASSAPWNGVPASFGNAADDNPAYGLSLSDVQAVLTAWNATEGRTLKLRLPTSAEWEIAARAGTDYGKYFWGDDAGDASVYAVTADTRTADGALPVSELREPNPYGFYDMLGNVWEWVDSSNDDTTSYALAGGSWNDKTTHCRFGNRLSMDSGVDYALAGVRLVMYQELPADDD